MGDGVVSGGVVSRGYNGCVGVCGGVRCGIAGCVVGFPDGIWGLCGCVVRGGLRRRLGCGS